LSGTLSHNANRSSGDSKSMVPQRFDKVWYLCGDSITRIFKPLAYEDVGTLIVSDTRMEFKSNRRTLVIDRLVSVSYQRQGRDFVNNWVGVEYDEAGSRHIAYFADGGMLGWGGLLGGTKRIYDAVVRLPAAGDIRA
jgi:hypothetical protein